MVMRRVRGTNSLRTEQREIDYMQPAQDAGDDRPEHRDSESATKAPTVFRTLRLA